jgi:hypothetical protein
VNRSVEADPDRFDGAGTSGKFRRRDRDRARRVLQHLSRVVPEKGPVVLVAAAHAHHQQVGPPAGGELVQAASGRVRLDAAQFGVNRKLMRQRC